MASPHISKIHERVRQRAAAPDHASYVQKRADDAAATAEAVEEAKLKDLINALDQQQLPPNDFWDRAENAYQVMRNTSVQASMDLADELSAYNQDLARSSTCRDPMRLAALITQLGDDTGKYLESLDTIHNDHADKTGGTVTGDDHMAVLKINERYGQAHDIFQTVVGPIVNEIHELIGTTDLAVAAMKANLEAQLEKVKAEARDPNIITDVEAKG
jgi:hypothetical protein